MSLLNFFWPEKDKVWIEIPIEASKPIELLIIQKKEIKMAYQNMPHLKAFVSPFGNRYLDNTSLCVLAESEEAASVFLA